ncbi:MAG: PEP/pyruvate-binding domain-containing protein, partial [Bacteroidota bacterium]
NTGFNLLIIDVSGKKIFNNQDVSKNGWLNIDFEKDGIYYIKLTSQKGNRVYSIIQINNTLTLGRINQTNLISGEYNYSDTLLLSIDGYYDSKILVSDISTVQIQQYQMLKLEYDNLYYFNVLLSKNAYDMISSEPSKTHLGNIESVKAMVDKSADLVYYMNTNLYLSHYIFAVEQMNYPYEHSIFNAQQYTDSPQRYLFPITINYYSDLDIYTFEFFAGTGASCEDIYHCYEKLLETSYMKEKLYFYSTNALWDSCHDIPTITPNELFDGQNYQALNLAENYGYLQKVNITDVGNTELQRHDILLTDGIPLDLNVIAGIITTEFQSPLSHINVLSHNRGTPNMALKDGFTNPVLDSLIGELVYLQVLSNSFTIRKASLSEAMTFWVQFEPSDTIVLEKDTSDYGLIDLNNCSLSDVIRVGGKAANFSELINTFDATGIEPPLPEAYFAIPFCYYEHHLANNDIDSYIVDMLNNVNFWTNSSTRKMMLSQLRDSIINSPVDQNLYDSVYAHLLLDPRFTSFQFRSSTNAEDLEGFNGAGLYDSFTGKLIGVDYPIDMAIKNVWASLWNFTAFEEREYYNIDQLSCSMGILVHRSFPDEDANGVTITKNMFNINHGYMVNVQFGDISVVNPFPGVICDQLVIYTFSLIGEPYTIEYNYFSNVSGTSTEHVMTDVELYKLGDYLGHIKNYFFNNVYDCNCPYNDFGLDIEFKLDSQVNPRKLYIKQARPY